MIVLILVTIIAGCSLGAGAVAKGGPHYEYTYSHSVGNFKSMSTGRCFEAVDMVGGHSGYVRLEEVLCK